MKQKGWLACLGPQSKRWELSLNLLASRPVFFSLTEQWSLQSGRIGFRNERAHVATSVSSFREFQVQHHGQRTYEFYFIFLNALCFPGWACQGLRLQVCRAMLWPAQRHPSMPHNPRSQCKSSQTEPSMLTGTSA